MKTNSLFKYWFGAFLSTAGLTLLACSDSSSPTPATGTVTQAEAGTKFADVWCRGVENCCSADNPFNATKCADNKALLDSAISEALSKHPGSVYDGALLGRCLDELSTKFVGKTCNPKKDKVRIPNCGGFNFVHGSKALGDACEDTSDCVPSTSGRVSCSTVTETGTDKVCALVVEILSPGAQCSDWPDASTHVATLCADGYCYAGKCIANDTGVCGTTTCTSDQYCTSGASPSTCDTKKAVGSECDSRSECVSGGCGGSPSKCLNSEIAASCADPTFDD